MTSVESLGDKDGICTYRWTISDNGMGMSKEFLSHIFEPFVQEKMMQEAFIREQDLEWQL